MFERGKSFVLQQMFSMEEGLKREERRWWWWWGGIKLIFSPYWLFFFPLLLFYARLFLPHGSDRLFELKGKAIRS